MNSKFFILSFSVFIFGCGVKAKPLRPPEKAIQSYIESYTGTATTTPLPPIEEKQPEGQSSAKPQNKK